MCGAPFAKRCHVDHATTVGTATASRGDHPVVQPLRAVRKRVLRHGVSRLLTTERPHSWCGPFFLAKRSAPLGGECSHGRSESSGDTKSKVGQTVVRRLPFAPCRPEGVRSIAEARTAHNA